MASELRVDTLKDSSGNNSVGMAYVAGGSAKAWVNFNGTGTIATRDSVNISSLDDDGTGLFGTNFTSSFSNVNYAQAAIHGNEVSSSVTSMQVRGYAQTTTTSASAINTFYSTSSTTANTDQTHNAVLYHGDLA